jgi:hypothetical protein
MRQAMASTLPTYTAPLQHDLHEDAVVAVVDAAELAAAQSDPRVRSFHEEADAYLAELERQGRNR